MKFASKVDRSIIIFITIPLLMMYIPTFSLLREPGTAEIFILLFILLINAILLWMIFGTYYLIKDPFVHYNNGPIKGKIKIEDIHTIVIGKTLWVGFRPATARKGLIIKYQKYDEIYISPKEQDRFVEEILKLKPSVKIEEKRENTPA